MYVVKGACAPDWNGILHVGWARSNGRKVGFGGSVGKHFLYICLRRK